MELKDIKGLGEKRIALLNEKGIFSCEDLIRYLPKTYFDLSSKDTFAEDGKYKLIRAEVVSEVKVARIRRDFGYSFFTCKDGGENLFKAVFYNQPYIKNAIKEGDILYLYGKNSNSKHGHFVVSTYRNQNKIKQETDLLPVYKSYKGLGQSVITSAIKGALEKETVDSFLPKEFEKQYLIPLMGAYQRVHYPESKEALLEAKERLDIENILPLIKLNNDIKNCKNCVKPQKYDGFSQVLDQICSFLPFKLTPSQLSSLEKIERGLKGEKPLSMLLQGDVGSGKTIVAFICAAACVSGGYSCIMLAPTEILARQHYEGAKKILGENVELLTSSTRPLERARILASLSRPTFLIGTHSVLSDQLDASHVGLFIIDEQHRFGVKQRSAILDRVKTADLLMLSATPIPRSLSIVYYGGLESCILEKPPFAKRIQTNLVSEKKEEDMWKYVSSKIGEGSKVYVVCANIDDTDDDCYEGLSVSSMHKALCERFGKDKVLMAHGRVDAIAEASTLEKFKNSDASILVSTTIVEVGVDIPQADIMVIVSPEKFGLATLHQLRGRIGRAGQQSYCFCMTRNLTEKSAERIKFFKEHDDGFEIAEFDYNSRGAGNILSTMQHGRIDNPFDLVSLATLKKAKELFDRLETEYEDTAFLLSGVDTSALKGIGLN